MTAEEDGSFNFSWDQPPVSDCGQRTTCALLQPCYWIRARVYTEKDFVSGLLSSPRAQGDMDVFLIEFRLS